MEIFEIIIGSIIFTFALLGIFAAIVYGVKTIKRSTYEEAIFFMRETILDLMYGRKNYGLQWGDFPLNLRHDIESLLSDEEKKQWESVLNMKSRRMESWGIGETAFYSFIIPYKYEYLTAYKEIISNLATECLSLAKCSITDVIVEFEPSDIPDYATCIIWYARTAKEQEAFYKKRENAELDAIGSTISETRDDDLDAELDLFGE